MSAYDTASLLADIRRRCSAPTAAPAGADDASLLATADDEMRAGLAPLLVKLRKEHFVASYDIATTPGVAAYDLPPRALGLRLRDVGTVDAAGKFTSLRQMEIDELDGLSPTSGAPCAFYLQDTQLVLYPTPNAAVTLRLPYYCARNRLVQLSAVGVVTGATATQVTLSGTAPSTFTTSAKLDLVRGSPHFRHLAMDITPTGVSGNAVTFAAGVLPAGIAAGDQLCLAGEAAVPQIPFALHALLAQRAATEWMRGTGYPGLPDAERKVAMMEDAALSLLAPRVDGEVEVLTSDHFYPGFS